MPSSSPASPGTWPVPSSIIRNSFPTHCVSAAGEVQLQLDEAVRAVTQAGIHVVVAAGEPGCHFQ